MAPVGGAAAPARAPGPTNVLILTKIPEGITEQQIASGAGRYSEVLQVSYRQADPDGPGWAIIAFASPELAKLARERLDGKPLPGLATIAPLEATLGEGLFGNIRSHDQNSPWKEARTPQGQVYYYHAVTRQTSWTKPPPDFPPVVPGTVPPPHGGLPALPGAGQHLARPPFVVPARRPLLTGLLPAGTSVVAPPPPPVQAQAAIHAAQATAAAAQASAAAEPGATANAGPVGANLFIYHIPNSWDDTILRQHFEHFGKIVSCRVQKDPDGRPRGFGFVSYDAATAAQAAIAGMHGFPVEGKHLKVQLKKGDEQQLSPTAPSMGGPSLAGLLETQTAGMPNQPPPPPGLPPGLTAATLPSAATAPSGFTPARPDLGATLVRPAPY